MKNLIGSEVDDYAKWLQEPGASVHLYGKATTRDGRKMGHVTRVFEERLTRELGRDRSTMKIQRSVDTCQRLAARLL